MLELPWLSERERSIVRRAVIGAVIMASGVVAVSIYLFARGEADKGVGLLGVVAVLLSTMALSLWAAGRRHAKKTQR